MTELAELTYRYPGAERPALDRVDLELAAGEFVLLAGLSGSGKSTLLRALCGLVPHYFGGEASGELSVLGLDVRENGPAELGGAVGMVMQDPEAQVISATVRGELELPLELRGETPSARTRAIEEVVLALGIPHLLDRPTDTLSGGELQRVALASALVLRPRLVLLDEPTSQLDPIAGDELIGLLRRLNEEWGMGVVLAEHRVERCLGAVDRVIAMRRGSIAFDGGPRGFCEWAIEQEPAMAPPGARMFSLAGLAPLPVSVKEARRTLDPPAPAAVPDVARPQARVADGRRAPAGGGRTALEARDLWIELDRGEGPEDVLRAVDVHIGAGERVALMGRNGAGKTTLLRAAAGLVEPSRGVISAPAGTALLPQSPGDLFLADRVSAELPGEPGERALRDAGLEWAAGADPRDLSGGERERLALAIVLAGRERDRMPGLLAFDEPTRGVDPARKLELATWLGEVADRGPAVLVATHDVEFAARFAERVLLLGDGELIADGGADEILSGGWFFATEVARILGGDAAITPEQGAAVLAARAAAAARPQGAVAP